MQIQTHDYGTATVEASAQHRAWILAWMRAHREEHRDNQMGEINHTALVEDWDRSCADGRVTMDSNHPAWEIALDVK